MQPFGPPRAEHIEGVNSMTLLARAGAILAASTALAAALLLAPPATRGQDAQSPAASGEFDLALIDHGGRIEGDLGAQAGKAWHLIAGTADEYYWSSSEDPPQEVVLSFLGRQSALISGIVLSQSASGAVDAYAKDVEVWISSTSPDQGFVKLGAAVMPRESGAEQRLDMAPVEARFVKLRITSNHSPDAASSYTELGRIKVIEGSRSGYQSLLQRNPDLAALLSGAEPAQVFPAPAAPAADAATAAAAEGCEPSPPPPAAPSGPGTRHLLVVRNERSGTYPPLDYRKDPNEPQSDFYRQLDILAPPDPAFVRPAMLSAGGKIDTVVLSQLCDIQTSVSDAFKKALVAWVAEGHKLIIHDADNCSGDAAPDYSFLPYKFATSNPGARGARGDNLIFVEENAMAHGRKNEPGFLDLQRWREEANELGDSNTITAYDTHWCGHLFGTNVLEVNGFIEAYAHHGRGLIVYDGFDLDQAEQPDYRRLVTRELMQPFDPDGLLCSAKLGDFVIATDEPLKSQPMIPGRSYRYPLTLLSNQGYQGKVALSITPVPADPGVSWKFDADSIDLTAISKTNLLVSTTPQALRGAHALGVRGIDAAGKSALLCLRLPERTSGGLRVTSAALSAKPHAKNLEIILDLSGSMKLPLGKSTRIATARQVLRGVLQKIPDDFNVGLRFYGNRYGSRQKETCTDTELVGPIAPLDRDALQSLVDGANPRGETPLVYSVLQTPADLKEVGGGSVVLITDGEESCKGDPAKAAQQLRASGVDVTLNIVGFTLTGKEVQQQLTTLAEATGGHFYRADNAETLSRALLNAAIDRIPFSVFAADGSKVAEGETNGDAIELAPGIYKVVARTGDQELVADRVAVTAAGDVALEVMLEDGRFRIGGAP
jgi:hypothetical protein